MSTLKTTDVPIRFGVELTAGSLEAGLASAYKAKSAECSIQFDMSKVRFVQIDSLLFLLCVLSHLKRLACPISLVLPEHEGRWDFDDCAAPDDSEEGRVRKVRDFLKRWEFDLALREAVGDVPSILPEHQSDDYFAAPLRYYRPSSYRMGGESLESSLLIEISHMTRGQIGCKRVDESKITEFISRRALEKRFQQSICQAVGREPQYFGKEFASTVLTEALINTYEHPSASLAMIGLARGSKGWLTAGIADNGDLIPSTIEDDFETAPSRDELLRKVDEKRGNLVSRFADPDKIPEMIDTYTRHVAATLYATQLGTSSKKTESRPKRGEGLYYVKTRTLEFGGRCTIRTGNAQVTFYKENGEERFEHMLVAPWPGNLVTIAIPTAFEKH